MISIDRAVELIEDAEFYVAGEHSANESCVVVPVTRSDAVCGGLHLIGSLVFHDDHAESDIQTRLETISRVFDLELSQQGRPN